ELDPYTAGLGEGEADAPCADLLAAGACSATERTERTETQSHGETEDTKDTDAIGERWGVETQKQIHDAIRRTVPPAYGKRNYHIFKLCRALKAIPSVGKLKQAELLPLKAAVHEWHRLAKPNILTKDFGVTWGDFVYAWPRVKHAEGEDSETRALERA